MKIKQPIVAIALAGVSLLLVSATTFISGSLDRTVKFEVSPGTDAKDPLFPTDVITHEDAWIITTNKGDKAVRFYNTSQGLDSPYIIFHLDQEPTGLVVGSDPDKPTLYVTTFDNQGILEVVTPLSETEYKTKSIRVGHGPVSPIVWNKNGKELVYVLNQFSDDVMEVDPAAGKVLRSVKVLRQPKGAVITNDGKYMFVTNYKPMQRADVDYVAADVSVIDMNSFKKIKDIKLANGSNALRGISLSSDGKYVFVSHNLGRFTVPTSQLQQGWMNTSAMSVIDVAKQEFMGSLILDDPERGAAGVWDIKAVDDRIFVTHSGTHEISVIDYPAMIGKLTNYKGAKEDLEYDLRFMYGLRERIKLEGNGPRKMAAVKQGDAIQLYIPTYFSDTLNLMKWSSQGVELSNVALVKDRLEDDVQAGERIFNDAMYCFQNWQSCNGCHPDNAREDGMNWDLMNDGIGNSKNCKSLLYSPVTPPSMISGIRATAELAVEKGFTHIQFYNLEKAKEAQVYEYVKSLEAVPSPYLVNGELSEKAKEGRKVYERLGCGECHSGPYYTDMKMHRIGDDIEFDAGWDTPTLREVWRTAPYLFDGRAATMRDVFEVHRHGIEKGTKITSKEIDQLVEYVNSL